MNFKEWLSEEDLQEGFWDSAAGLAGGVARGVGQAGAAAWQGYSNLADRGQNQYGRQTSPKDAYFGDLKNKMGDWQKVQAQDAADQKRGLMSNAQIQALTKEKKYGQAYVQNIVKQYLQGNPSVDPAPILNTINNDKDIPQISKNLIFAMSANDPRKIQLHRNELYQKVQSALGLVAPKAPGAMSAITGK